MKLRLTHRILLVAVIALSPLLPTSAAELTLNRKDTGYRGIWYMNQPSGDEYVYKYSAGLGTYCAKHKPFAIYRKEVDKTFVKPPFCPEFEVSPKISQSIL